MDYRLLALRAFGWSRLWDRGSGKKGATPPSSPLLGLPLHLPSCRALFSLGSFPRRDDIPPLHQGILTAHPEDPEKVWEKARQGGEKEKKKKGCFSPTKDCEEQHQLDKRYSLVAVMICLGNRLIWSQSDTDLSFPLYLLLLLRVFCCDLRACCRAEHCNKHGSLGLFTYQANGEDLCNRRPRAIPISF